MNINNEKELSAVCAYRTYKVENLCTLILIYFADRGTHMAGLRLLLT
jgi:hypothetical protein